MDIKSKSQFKRIAMTNPIVATEEWFSTLEENRKLKEELENLKKIAPSDENVFKGEDFSRAELQRKFGEEADWYYNRLAQIANGHIRPLLEKINALSADAEKFRNLNVAHYARVNSERLDVLSEIESLTKQVLEWKTAYGKLQGERDSLAQAFIDKDDKLTRLQKVAVTHLSLEELEILDGRVRRVFKEETAMPLLSREFAHILTLIRKAIELKKEPK